MKKKERSFEEVIFSTNTFFKLIDINSFLISVSYSQTCFTFLRFTLMLNFYQSNVYFIIASKD